MARSVVNNARQSDLIARLGGDEFVGLFPEADYTAAGALLEKIRNALAAMMNRQASPITFSIGAITFDTLLEKICDMLNAADDLMYGVKKQGRNNVVHQRWE